MPEAAVREDDAEALAYLVDPFDLVGEVPGVELAQASWSSEPIDYDPDAVDWADEEDRDDGVMRARTMARRATRRGARSRVARRTPGARDSVR